MATLTITTTTAQDLRLVSAYGLFLNLVDANGDPRTATAAEIKSSIINSIKQVVFDQENKVEIEAISIPVFDPS